MLSGSLSPLPYQPSSPGPDPLGGDAVAIVNAVVEVVPVRLVNTNAIDVRVMNFPGQPPPLPGLRPSAAPPPLPGARVRPAGGSGGLDLNALGLGGLLKLGTVAGAVALGLAEIKTTFIDPILGSAKGGFDRGLHQGAGAETFGKSFQVLGVVIGTTLLPQMVELAGTAGGLAEVLDQNKRKEKERSTWDKWLFGWTPKNVLDQAGSEGDSRLTKLDKVLSWQERNLNAAGWFGFRPGTWARREVLGRPEDGSYEKLNRAEKEATRDVLQSLVMSLNPAPAYYDVADVRGQANLAAVGQDPLERRMRETLLRELAKISAELEKMNAGEGAGGTSK